MGIDSTGTRHRCCCRRHCCFFHRHHLRAAAGPIGGPDSTCVRRHSPCRTTDTSYYFHQAGCRYYYFGQPCQDDPDTCTLSGFYWWGWTEPGSRQQTGKWSAHTVLCAEDNEGQLIADKGSWTCLEICLDGYPIPPAMTLTRQRLALAKSLLHDVVVTTQWLNLMSMDETQSRAPLESRRPVSASSRGPCVNHRGEGKSLQRIDLT